MAIPVESEELAGSLRCAHVLRRHGAAIVLLVCVTVFYLATIRQGNTWGDDFALYIRHAENIAADRPYSDTGYIYNPAVPIYGPPAYPPVFPLLLAPIYHFAGLNFWAMKCEQVVFFVLALFVIYLNLLRYTSRVNASLVIAILGFNPNFWAAKDNILSDLPFLFFFWLAAWLALRPSRSWGGAVLLGTVFYLAVGTRILGITMVAGFLLHELFTRRRLTAFTAIPLAICLVLLAAQTRIMALGQGSSFDLFHPTVASVIGNFFSYARALPTFWMGNSKTAFILSMVTVTTGLAMVGLYAHGKRRIAVLEISIAVYLAAVILWPGRPGLRLIYPVIPFYVYLVIAGLRYLTAYRSRLHTRTLAIALILLGATYVSIYGKVNWEIIPETDGLASFNDLCRHVQVNTHNSDVFLCRRPRALTLFTRRPAAVYDTSDDTAWWRFAEKIHVSYLLCNRRETQDVEFLLPFIARSEPHLELTYQNSDFDLYRIRGYDSERLKRNLPSPESANGQISDRTAGMFPPRLRLVDRKRQAH